MIVYIIILIVVLTSVCYEYHKLKKKYNTLNDKFIDLEFKKDHFEELVKYFNSDPPTIHQNVFCVYLDRIIYGKITGINSSVNGELKYDINYGNCVLARVNKVFNSKEELIKDLCL